jgi:hypothetical protein
MTAENVIGQAGSGGLAGVSTLAAGGVPSQGGGPGVTASGFQITPTRAETTGGAGGGQPRYDPMADLAGQREELLASYQGAERGLETVTNPVTGEVMRRSAAGTMVPGAPSYYSLWNVGEGEIAGEASPRLEALRREQALREPRVGRQAWMPWAGKGFGLGKRSEEAAREAVAEYGVGIAGRRAGILTETKRDILERRQSKERWRQGLYAQAMAENAEAEEARRFELGLKLDSIRDEEGRVFAREEARKAREWQEEQAAIDRSWQERFQRRQAELTEEASGWF